MSSPPPPPPPPPPPLPPSSMALLGKQALTSSAIKPTTAGLFAVRTASDHFKPLPDIDLGGPSFKNELLERHQRFSNANATTSIEDRIRNNGREQMMEPTSAAGHPGSMPDKLMSAQAAPGDKRPFAYSPDVNDPNNRGKLDLNQIKSPTMRRRLLANMDSAEEHDDQQQQSQHQQHQQETSNDNRNNLSPPNLTYYPPNGSWQQQVASPATCHNMGTQPTIQYNAPPSFYTSCSATHSSVPSVEQLDLELAKSLDSLSQMVSDMGTTTTTNLRPNTGVNQHAPRMEYHQPRLSTFSTSSGENFHNSHHHHNHQVINNREMPRTRAVSHSPSNYLTSQQQQRLVGDYLLAPNTDYFVTSGSSPYSMSPYYGDSLDVDGRGFMQMEPNYARQQQQHKRTSSRTFLTRPNSSDQNDQLRMRDESMKQLARSLRMEAERIEAELDRLNNLSRDKQF